MSLSVWNSQPPFDFGPTDAEKIYQVSGKWVVTDDPAKATPAVVDAVLTSAIPADFRGFLADLKGLVGGAVNLNTLAKQYPILLSSINNGNWSDLQALILDANSSAKITPTQYASIKTFAANRHIPITLP